MESNPVEVAGLASRLRRLVTRRPDAWLQLDITMPQLRTLFAVRERGTVTMSELATTLGQRLPATSTLVNRLVDRGLLRRLPDPDDRRRVLVALSEDAERTLSAADDRAAARFAAIVGRMSPAGRAALATALDELITLATADQPTDT